MESCDCVDAHFHIWDLQKFSYLWPTEKEPVLFRNYTVDDLKSAMLETPVRHAVFVQVLNNSPEEALWLSQLAEQHDVIKGIVAGIDVSDKNLEQTLDSLSGKKKIVGVRHILDMEEQDWLSRNDVIAGLRVLERRGIPFDLLLRPPLIKHVPRLSEELPRLNMVVDHLAKPYIKNGLIDEWAKDMEAAAANPNVYCKLSGMVTEADLNQWKVDQFEPYVKGQGNWWQNIFGNTNLDNVHGFRVEYHDRADIVLFSNRSDCYIVESGAEREWDTMLHDQDSLHDFTDAVYKQIRSGTKVTGMTHDEARQEYHDPLEAWECIRKNIHKVEYHTA